MTLKKLLSLLLVATMLLTSTAVMEESAQSLPESPEEIIAESAVIAEPIDEDCETTDEVIGTVDEDYETTDEVYETTDEVYGTVDEDYETTGEAYETTDEVYETANELPIENEREAETADETSVFVADDSVEMLPMNPDGEMTLESFEAEADLNLNDSQYEAHESEAYEGVTYAANGVAIDAANFPDASFRNYVFQFDTDGDNQLSDQERQSVVTMEITTPVNGQAVADLTGIRQFPNLNTINVSGLPLTTLDVSGFTGLENLSCDFCQLTSLNVNGCSSLKKLECQSNQLTSLDLNGCGNLWFLSCRKNQLSSLDVGGFSQLTYLYCEDNQLTTLNLSGCGSLHTIYCWNNQLTVLDVSGLTNLELLNCSDNQLTVFKLKGCSSLKTVNAYNNQFSTLDASGCINLTSLTCQNTPLVTSNQKTKITFCAIPGAQVFLDTIYLEYAAPAGSSYKSSNKNVATITQNGRVKIRKVGKTKLTYKMGGAKHTIVLNVKKASIPISISLSAPSTTVKKGDKVAVTATLSAGVSTGIKWKSSNKKVARVNSNGMVTFKKKGKVTITATTKKGNKKAKIKFTVTN